MSFQGHNSYAHQLENRVISQNWISYWRRQGRMVYRRIHAPDPDPNGYTQQMTIGFEMVTNASDNRWNARREPDRSIWLFRCYHDGTALYKEHLTHSILNRYNTMKSIDDVVYKHFYRDAIINGGEEYSYDDQIVLLRRKPLSTYARIAAEKENNLGDFLMRKYNMGGERETVSC